ncbi:aminoglycoside phosphotransferase family protein [Spirochaetota bacterium]
MSETGGGMIPEKKIQSFLKKNIGPYNEVNNLTGDASAREYCRIHTDEKSYILCIDSLLAGTDSKDYPFTTVHKILDDAEINVPSIYAIDNKNGLILLQDLGDTLLEELLPQLPERGMIEIYSDIIETIIKIQQIKGKDDVPFGLSFNIEKLMFEFDFFIENALKKYFGLRMPESEVKELRNEFLLISNILDRPEHFVLNHRDFHSRNIMINDNIPYFIDFQDARMGLPQYDIVSLLRDSYIELEEDVFNVLKYFYYDISGRAGIHSMSLDEFDFYFNLMAFQRNIKALGTFGFMVTAKNDMRYEKHIKPTLAYIKDYAEKHDELRGAFDILDRYLGL